MSPLTHKILVGVVASVTAAGIAAGSNMVLTTVEASARIEAKVGDIANDFDNFVNLRYQADMDRIEQDVARVNNRIDDALQGYVAP